MIYKFDMITPQENSKEMAKELGLTSLYFKREDLHPYGSHKGRSLPVMINEYVKQGKTRFAISSSGNAALAAGLYLTELNKQGIGPFYLEIFIGMKISSDKEKILRKKLKDQNILIVQSERPLQAYSQKIATLPTNDPTEENITVKNTWQGLRQSTDNTALMGYQTLAEELAKIDNLEAIFIGSSSGTCAQSLAEYFIASKKNPQIHIVQTSSCNPISREFDKVEMVDEQSVADAIVDKTSFRKERVVELITASKGFGWTVSNQEIKDAQDKSKALAHIEVSPNGALALAGLIKAKKQGWVWKGAVVCIITGR